MMAVHGGGEGGIFSPRNIQLHVSSLWWRCMGEGRGGGYSHQEIYNYKFPLYGGGRGNGDKKED